MSSMTVKRQNKNRLIRLAIARLHALNVDYKRHNADTHFVIETKRGVIDYWPSTECMRMNDETLEDINLNRLVQKLKAYGFKKTRSLEDFINSDEFKYSREVLRLFESGEIVEVVTSKYSELEAATQYATDGEVIEGVIRDEHEVLFISKYGGFNYAVERESADKSYKDILLIAGKRGVNE